VRYVGDPVAVVLAENSYVAVDARDLVEVDYAPLPAMTDPEMASAPEVPLLYEELGSNVAFLTQAGGAISGPLSRARIVPCGCEWLTSASRPVPWSHAPACSTTTRPAASFRPGYHLKLSIG